MISIKNKKYYPRGGSNNNLLDWAEHPTLEQYFGLPGNIQHNPEKLLALAILEDAINCFQGNRFQQDKKSRNLFQNARNWIFDDCYEGIHSFGSICNMFDFEPKYLRAGLLRWEVYQLTLPTGNRHRPQRHRVASKGREMLVGKKRKEP